MAHVNTLLREAVRERLVNNTDLVSIFTNRGANIGDADLPSGIIETGSDEVERATMDGSQQRTVQLSVVIVALGNAEGIDDLLDTLRAQVEVALADNLDGLAFRMIHTGANLEVMDDEDGAQWYAFYALGWEVQIWTQVGEPEQVAA